MPKGKLHRVLALHQRGASVEAIARRTGRAPRVIDRYLAAYAEGLEAGSFERYRGEKLSTADLCRLHGIWWRLYGHGPVAAP